MIKKSSNSEHRTKADALLDEQLKGIDIRTTATKYQKTDEKRIVVQIQHFLIFVAIKMASVEDCGRIVLEIGNTTIKIGVAGEMQPRSIVIRDSEKEDHVYWMKLLRRMYRDVLLTEEGTKRMLISESILMPSETKRILGHILFHHFRVITKLFGRVLYTHSCMNS